MKQWYYASQGERKGPVDAGILQDLYRQGQIRPDDLVWEEGMPDWCKASSVLPAPSAQPGSSPVPPPSTPSAPVPTFGASPPARAPECTMALISMISGIVSLPGLFCCGLLGLVPVITGHLALSEIKKNPSLSGKGMAQAGLIMGYITLSITLLILLAYVVFIIIGVASGSV